MNPVRALKICLLSLPLLFFTCCNPELPVQEETTPTTPIEGVVPVTLQNYTFTPKQYLFTKDETVEFHLMSTDEAHTFTIKELGINWVVSPSKEPQKQLFIFDRTGRYQLICILPEHEENGMVGEIIVN